ncbi:Ig-like domain-containing protein [Streptomyces sp. NPDC004647]|uniref:L,D-transpeptidase n=1 Tax=Streptomyces sp. NPDC004647 TaxID=3154671 RepID=UPI00339EFAB6
MRQVAGRVGRTGAVLAVAVAVAVAVVVALTAVAGCGGSGAGFGGPPHPRAQGIKVVPPDRANGVLPGDPVEVSVAEGRLERVRVVRIDGGQDEPVAGTISRDGRRWLPSSGGRLELAGTYSVNAVAVDGRGHRTVRHTTFTADIPDDRFIGFFRPGHHALVGTGMIVSLEFNRHIADRAAVERGIRVSASPPVRVAGHWFGSRRLDFRPRTYWRPGTEVSIRMRLRDVEASQGIHGVQQGTVRFTIGRSQTSTVDAAAHTMTVLRDGRRHATLPISAGAPGSPTYNGKMVVMERYAVTRMDGDTVGFRDAYDIPDVPHALRLTTSGTFLHGNYWAPPSTFGMSNTSHGCIGLRDVRGGRKPTPARWFYENSLVGDVVEVVRSTDRMVDPHNGLSGWNMSWAKWRAGSALN